jgi:hypothetical protein
VRHSFLGFGFEVTNRRIIVHVVLRHHPRT